LRITKRIAALHYCNIIDLTDQLGHFHWIIVPQYKLQMEGKGATVTPFEEV
jgi:hypothetical protein